MGGLRPGSLVPIGDIGNGGIDVGHADKAVLAHRKNNGGLTVQDGHCQDGPNRSVRRLSFYRPRSAVSSRVTSFLTDLDPQPHFVHVH